MQHALHTCRGGGHGILAGGPLTDHDEVLRSGRTLVRCSQGLRYPQAVAPEQAIGGRHDR